MAEADWPPREAQFANVDRQNAHTSTNPLISHMALAIDRDREISIARFLSYVDERGWLAEFIDIFIIPNISPEKLDDLKQALLGTEASPSAEGVADDLEPHLASRICWVSGPGAIGGTGFLVGPNLVLTSHHTISSVEASKTNPGLTCHFQMLALEPTPQDHNNGDCVAQVGSKDWLVASSSAHPHERLGRRVSDEDLQAFGDFALIRLSDCVGLSRGWFTLAGPPSRGEGVAVLHRSARARAKRATSTVTRVRPLQNGLRIYLQTADGFTTAGASGAPCINRRGLVTAIHQAGGEGRTKAQRSNRAVAATYPLSSIESVPTLQTQYLWWVRSHSLDNDRYLGPWASEGPFWLPLVGRWEFQDAVRNARDDPAAPRVLNVNGRAGSGRTISRSIVRTLCLDSEHLIAELDVSTPGRSQATLMQTAYETIRRRAGHPAGTGNDIEAPPETAVYLRVGEYVKSVIARIDAVREGRGVWICIDGFGEGHLSKEVDRLSLEHLVARTTGRVDGPALTWLRLVLLGPVTLPLISDLYAESISQPNDAEIAAYVTARRFAAGADSWSDAVVQSFCRGLRRNSGGADVSPQHVVLAVNATLTADGNTDRPAVVNPWIGWA